MDDPYWIPQLEEKQGCDCIQIMEENPFLDIVATTIWICAGPNLHLLQIQQSATDHVKRVSRLFIRVDNRRVWWALV